MTTTEASYEKLAKKAGVSQTALKKRSFKKWSNMNLLLEITVPVIKDPEHMDVIRSCLRQQKLTQKS